MRTGTAVFLVAWAGLGGCGAMAPGSGAAPGMSDAGSGTAADGPAIRPRARPSPAAGAAPRDGGGGETAPLGTTIAALGDPTRPGLWMETPLVSAEAVGTVAYGGRSVRLTLVPAGGAATGGSRLSLAAMQALGAPLTDLVEVRVAVPG